MARQTAGDTSDLPPSPPLPRGLPLLNQWGHYVRPSAFDTISRHHPPTYEGETEPAQLEDWIIHFERMFRVTTCPSEDKINIATFFLRGAAQRWWETMREPRMVDPSFGWEEFVALIRDRYYPPHIKNAKMEEFINLKQRNLDVEEYFEKFITLSRMMPSMVTTEEAKISKFLNGLNRKLKDALAPFAEEITTLQAFYEKAADIDRVDRTVKQALKRERGSMSGSYKDKGKWQPRGETSTARGKHQGNKWRQNRNSGKPRNCPRCGRSHPSTDCDGQTIKCFNCGQPGHRATFCNMPRKKEIKGLASSSRNQNRVRGRRNKATADEAEQEAGFTSGNSLTFLSFRECVIRF